MTTPRPLWRWALFCAALEVYWWAGYGSRIGDRAAEIFGWCVLPSWLGYDGMPDSTNPGGEK